MHDLAAPSTSAVAPPATTGPPSVGAPEAVANTLAPSLESSLVIEPGGVQRSPRTRSGTRQTRWALRYRLLLLLLDFLSCSAAGWAVIHMYPQAEAGFFDRTVLNWTALLILPAAWIFALWVHGAYEGRYLGLGPDEFKRVLKAIISLTAVVCFLAFTQKADLSRLSVGTVLPLTATVTLLVRFVTRKALHVIRKRGRASQRILLVGTLGEALSVYRITTRNPNAGLVPVGICLTEPTSEQASLPIPVFNGKVEPLDRVKQVGADTIAVCGARGVSPEALRRLAWQLEGSGVDLVVAPSLTNIAGPRVHIRPVEGLPLLHVEEPTISGVGWLIKGLFDRLAAFFGLLLISPILGIAALAIKISDPGPVFFRQARAGRGGHTIRVWKFRTMYVDAEERLAELLGSNETDGLLFKMSNDPRITRVGHFLRKTSIDELPQLINVLLGEMSLVGPRPLPVKNEEFAGDVRRRMLVRPGITGLWQVSGRSNLSWEDAVRLDLYYVDNWSLAFDFMILYKTLFAVMKRDGAY
ncbi:sugar transferase [Cryptosporangium aurantiacum]|uniref:Undecaprenyl-phosphate galactose phosphotransferase, WbaP/exopolysaccharide biosynthesis polyprenyl glycosylphosphotransferase n=1 Tax=Cryptosporangium aurantiacum TaxID=134849 RepID=A0A1M7RL37_9ACTN|nr:sugar transferase [Cryptosporangium aurantiacum]SHN46788.1 Undecaprenyl-phosphate galactose phosphotransferase, WbaP/exopolysaccharide biosynthesis polyprenyl glycosylphosphotransferase [Cryptosporangium aurantiacum]